MVDTKDADVDSIELNGTMEAIVKIISNVMPLLYKFEVYSWLSDYGSNQMINVYAELDDNQLNRSYKNRTFERLDKIFKRYKNIHISNIEPTEKNPNKIGINMHYSKD